VIRQVVRGLVPAPVRASARRAYARLEPAFYAGSSVQCPCCGAGYRQFLPYEALSNVRCGRCGSLERHRLLCLYLRARTDLFSRPQRLLHFAPEPMLRSMFAALPNLQYVTSDYRPGAGVRMDITSLALRDCTFDAIICVHVLEHIPDDRRAMSELHRVLKPGGWAILQVPLEWDRACTYEDARITAPEERLVHFGQQDHVRRYGRDYPRRLQDAGFEVTVDDYVKTVPREIVVRHGLAPDEDIYVCRRRR
jgi:SAM-dependent methyltransferase